MYRYKPVYEAKEAANNARTYLKDHKDTFWNILKPLIPYLVAATFLDVVISILLSTDEKDFRSSMGSLICAYFVTALIISWHRLVIHGPEHFVPMNPFKPKKNEIKYLLVPIGLFVGFFIITMAIVFLGSLLGPAVIGISVFLLVIAATFFSLRIVFYFPALATDSPVTLAEAYKMTKGYVWKMFATGFLASWRMILVLMGYTFLMIVLLGGVAVFMGITEQGQVNMVMHALGFLLSLPMILYFQNIMAVIGVTVLSNYYQYAIQHGTPKSS